MMITGETKKRSLTRTDDPTTNPVYGEASSTDLRMLPKNVLRRVRALKKLQLEEIGVLSKYYKAVHKLEVKFAQEFEGIRTKRNAIVNGLHEPKDDECDIPLIHGIDSEELQKMEKEAPEADAKMKGIPNFWLTVLMNSEDIDIYQCDVPLLKHLTDITCELHTDPTGYTISFHFSDNPYFSNAVLKKHYELCMEPDSDEPFDFDGSVLVACSNDPVNWRDGMNLTKNNDNSFFNFFNFSNGAKLSDDLDDVAEADLFEDFEAGQAFRQMIIPRAVLYYTDEVDQSDEVSDSSNSDDSGDSDDSDESSDDGMEN